MAEPRLIGETMGSYEVMKLIGQGGMGQVYLAKHHLLGKTVAIKVLLQKYSHDTEMVNRFFNEARSATLIKHPGIVEIYDFGHHSSGCAYIVMEYLEGEALSERMRRERPMAFPLVTEIARQVSSALGAAHQKAIVHRDLKPDNVFLIADSELPMGIRSKILDFGIAKLVGDSSSMAAKTRTGAMMGTPRYMSPEQCRGAGAVDHRADVYSLGCMLFEMVTGNAPFVYEGVGEIIAAHIFQPPPLVSESAPNTPPELQRVIQRCLAKLPDERYASVLDVIKELAPLSPMRTPSDPLLAVSLPQILTPSRTNTPDARTGVVSGSATTLEAAASEVSVPSGTAGRRRWPLALAIALPVAVGVAGVLGWRARMPAVEAPKPVIEASKLAVEPAKPVIEPAKPVIEPARPKLVHHAITSVPAGAEVFRAADGARVGVTPLRLDREASDGEVVLIIKLPGYADERLTLSASADGEAEAKLRRKHAAAPPPAKKKKLKGGVLDPFAE